MTAPRPHESSYVREESYGERDYQRRPTHSLQRAARRHERDDEYGLYSEELRATTNVAPAVICTSYVAVARSPRCRTTTSCPAITPRRFTLVI